MKTINRRPLIFIKSFLRKAFFVSQKPFLLENIKETEIAANVGKFFKSPIISQKRDILNLILSGCKTEGKNLCFSMTKPFDKLLKTPEINKWCRWHLRCGRLRQTASFAIAQDLVALAPRPPLIAGHQSASSNLLRNSALFHDNH